MTEHLRVAIRVDIKDGTKDLLARWLPKVAEGFLVCYEEAGENKHVHGILECGTRKITAIRQCFRRDFEGYSGNGSYSIKVCDDNWRAFIRYICKGLSKDVPPVIWFKQGLDYTDEAIRRAHEDFYVSQRAVVESAERRSRIKKENLVEEIEKECKKRCIKGYDRVEIAKIYLNMFRDARKGVNLFAAKAVVNTVSMLLDGGDDAREGLARSIAEL